MTFLARHTLRAPETTRSFRDFLAAEESRGDPASTPENAPRQMSSLEAVIESSLARLDREEAAAQVQAVRQNGEAFTRQLEAENAAQRAAQAAKAAGKQDLLRRRIALIYDASQAGVALPLLRSPTVAERRRALDALERR
jgi:hypothetical protein